MICPICKGKRFLLYDAEPFNCALKTPCKRCNGTGNVVPNNFEKITRSPEALAELIVDAMFLYSTNRHIFTVEAVELANKKEGININLESVYKDVAKWLKQESTE